MMGRQTVDQSQLFYLFNLEEQFQRIISYAGSIQSSDPNAHCRLLL